MFKRSPKPVDELQQTIDGIVSSQEADQKQKEKRQEEEEAQLKKVIEIIDGRLRQDFLAGNPQFNTSEITIPYETCNKKKVIEQAVKIFEKKGWRMTEQQWGSATNKFVLKFKTGFHMPTPSGKSRVNLGWTLFITIAAVALVSLLN